jgi:hypothetical protein
LTHKKYLSGFEWVSWCQFHQLYTRAFFIRSLFRQLFLVTRTLRVHGKSCQIDVRIKKIVRKNADEIDT